MSEHPNDLLGPYSVDALDADEQRQVSEHLADCPGCREELHELESLRSRLEQVPVEAFLDGPPDGGDLLLARTLRRARAENRRPPVWSVAAAVVLILVALAGGLLIGLNTSSGPAPLAVPAGSTRVAATNHANGVHMTVVITPAKGWVRLEGAFTGVPGHARCYLMVVDRAGHRLVAGSWLAPYTSPPGGERVSGSALVPRDQVAAVQVVTFGGQVLATARV
jgi:Putative zinc-finger